jgi:preprotein translocase subunit SecD
MRKSGLLSLILTTVFAFGLLAFTLIAGYRPQLGLDLRGGVSVVLQPVVEGGKAATEIPEDSLEQTKEIIEQRVNAFGVGEPDVTVQGKNIVVQIPGIKDQKRALELVGKTAEMRFRPVLEDLGPAPGKQTKKQAAALRKKLDIPKGKSALDVYNAELVARGEQPIPDPNAPTTTTTVPADGATTTTVAPAPAEAPAATTTTPGSGTGGSRSAKVAKLRGQTPTTVAPTTTTPAPTTTTTIDPTPKNEFGIKVFKNKNSDLNANFQKLLQLENQLAQNSVGTTSREDDIADQEVVLPGLDDGSAAGVTRYRLGPTLLTGSAIDDATAGLSQSGQWEVRPSFKSGENGIDKFNKAAALCNSGDATCPTRQLAIVLDGVVQSAPTINESSFSKDQIQISGSFDDSSANDLATALRFGSLPLTLEAQTVQTVSATLGSGALEAGLIAGLVGIGLVGLFLLLYYRMLGAVTLAALAISASLLWSIICLLGEFAGLTLTLSGIVGIIVSIGVSLDSSVVYFENLKEDVRNGKTLRTAVDRSYTTAFSTIIKADVSSLIGAGVLWALSIGPVRGFALFLFISTVLDLFTSYFFTRPAVALLGKSDLGNRPELFGIPVSDLKAPPSAASPVPAGVSTGAIVDLDGSV